MINLNDEGLALLFPVNGIGFVHELPSNTPKRLEITDEERDKLLLNVVNNTNHKIIFTVYDYIEDSGVYYNPSKIPYNSVDVISLPEQLDKEFLDNQLMRGFKIFEGFGQGYYIYLFFNEKSNMGLHL